jgi:hypothetical protein
LRAAAIERAAVREGGDPISVWPVRAGRRCGKQLRPPNASGIVSEQATCKAQPAVGPKRQEEVAMSTILRSNGGYILIAISAFLFLFPTALPQDLRFLLGITCVPAALVFLLLKVTGGDT